MGEHSVQTHTTSLQVLSINCKVPFWMSCTGHIPNIGAAYSVGCERLEDQLHETHDGVK